MSTILQDMMGMLKRNGTVTPKADNYITVARYPNPQERLKPQPKLQTELVTLAQLKTFFNAGSSDEYVNAGTFDGATDILTLTRVGGTAITVDMNRKDTKQYINYTAVTVESGATVVLPVNSAGQIFLVTRAGANSTGTLAIPSAADAAWKFRKIYITTNGTANSARTLTVSSAAAGETINGEPSLIFSKVFASCALWSDGADWIILSSSNIADV